MLKKSLQEHLYNQAMTQSSKRSVFTAPAGDPAFAEVLAMKTARPEDLERFKKTNVVDEGDFRYVKESIYDVRNKQSKQIEDIVNQRVEDLERIHDVYEMQDYKFAMGPAGELIFVLTFKKKAC